MTPDDFVSGLRRLGVSEGDDVMFHSSLSSFGRVEGGAEAIVDAFLEAVGPLGTVLAPSFSRFELRRGVFGSWWDPAETPVYTGAISDALWRRPEARRSDHPTHAVAALGHRAAFFTAEHGLEGDRPSFWGTGTFGSASPWQKLVDEDVHYLMLGCGFEPATLAHHVESFLAAEDLAGLPAGEREGFARALRHEYYHREGPWPDIDRVELAKAIDDREAIDRVQLGWAKVERVGSARFFEQAVEICRAAPEAWLAPAYRTWRERIEKRRAEL